MLEGPNGLAEDQKGMIDIAVNFYKELFAKESRVGVAWIRSFGGLMI